MADALDQLLSQQAGGGGGGDALDRLLQAQASAKSQPLAVQVGADVNSIPRQIGLTARYGIEGLANTAQIATEPLRYITDRLTGSTGKTLPLGALASQALDAIGVPKPETPNERVVGDASRLVAGAGGMGAAAGAAAKMPGILGQTGSFLAQNMPQQLASAGGAGLLGGASREAGGNTGAQVGASLLGGVVGGMVPGAASSAAGAVRNVFAKPDPAALDQQISVALQRGGMDFSQLPQAVQTSLRKDVAQALQTGTDLNPDALRRLADFRLTGTTPTRGMVTLDPVQVTKEQNLAKIGANTADGTLHGLPQIQNQNNTRLIQNLNNAGASAGDPFRAGASVINAIGSQDESMARNVSSLYQQARDTTGRSLPLDGAAFTRAANQALDEGLLGGALPQDVANHMNRIARGDVPFTVDYAEQLKTRIGALQRASSDGSTRMALGTVRRALDDTPLMGAPQVNPGNLPAVPGTVPQSPLTAGAQSIDAFNQARSAARARFGWQESGRPIEAALNGAQPDNFVKQFVINGTLADATHVAQNAPTGEVRNAILAHLKEKALNGASDEVGKFSQSAFNKTLSQIGDRKLALFFSPEEIQALQANGRVASYMQVQPVGSAVNNSNSGALMLGKGYDALKGLLNKLPGGQALITQPLTNIEIAMKNRAAQNVVPGLLNPVAKPMAGQGLLLPGMAVGGLLAAP